MELRVNDYVRTKDGIVAKIVDVKENPYGEKTIFELDRKINIFNLEMSDIYFAYNPMAEETTNKIDTHFGDDKIIIKSSPNIIDILEVGDILVIKDFVDEACMIFTDIYLIQNEQQLLNIKNDLEKNKNKKLYSIVTKEMFSSVEYRVEND